MLLNVISCFLHKHSRAGHVLSRCGLAKSGSVTDCIAPVTLASREKRLHFETETSVSWINSANLSFSRLLTKHDNVSLQFSTAQIITNYNNTLLQFAIGITFHDNCSVLQFATGIRIGSFRYSWTRVPEN